MCRLREFTYFNSFLFCHAMPWPKLAYRPVSCVQLSWQKTALSLPWVAEWIKAGWCIHPVLQSLSFLLLQRSHVIPAEILSPPQSVRCSQRFLALLQGVLLSLLLSDMLERNVLQLDLAKFIFLNACHTAVIWSQDQISLVLNLSWVWVKAGVPGFFFFFFWRF